MAVEIKTVLPVFLAAIARLRSPRSNSTTMSAATKSLRIKTGSCKRLLKELHSYQKEVERESAKTELIKNAGADPHDLKQQENVLAESQMMIPNCKKRMEAALADLKIVLEEAQGESSQGSEDIEEAIKIVADIEAQIGYQ